MESLDQWWARGAHAHVLRPRGEGQPSARLDVFYRVLGEGPWLTLLHGFPSCSWDWAAVAPALGACRRLLVFDFLGFGDSSKPARHDYSLFEQADLAEEL
jgi:pimeloyl-ACP methyl ester carboxylesterase